MSDLKNWTARPFPAAKVLEGRYCRLEPLDVARHGADLWAVMAGANSVWDYLPAAPPKDRAGYDAVLAELLKSSDLLFTLIDRADGKAKGHLKMMEIRPAHGVFEVGWITYSPAVQRTRAATEAVYLIGDYGFSLGYRRYEWKCNNRNEPSKRAAERFGFKFEGIFRQHLVVKGENRDTAWYSIIDKEWPALRKAYEGWLDPANFDGAGGQKRRLEDFRADFGA